MGLCIVASIREILLDQIRERGVTKRAFAELLEIDESSLYRFIRPKNPDIPNPEILLKISKKTNVALETLISAIDPELAAQAYSRASSQLISQLMDELTEDEREFVLVMIQTMLRKRK